MTIESHVKYLKKECNYQQYILCSTWSGYKGMKGREKKNSGWNQKCEALSSYTQKLNVYRALFGIDSLILIKITEYALCYKMLIL